jgi:Family of unknown function (DUF5683)
MQQNLLAFLCALILMVSLGNGLFAQVTPQDSVPKPVVSGGKEAIKGPASSVDTAATVVTQTDTAALVITGDSTRKHAKGNHAFKLHLSAKKDFYDPKIAVRRSLILPGWGQIYDNRLWKVPIIYGGFAVFISFIITNHIGYLDYDRAVKCAGIPNLCVPNPYYVAGQIYTVPGLITIREGYRRNRDFNVILCGLWYLLNVVDAYVDSHLRSFNVSDDLSLNLDPSLGLDPFRQKNLVVGASLTFNLRR